MAIAPAAYAEVRRAADAHVQIRITRWPTQGRGDFRAEGVIWRIFRDQTGTLKRGKKIAFFAHYDRSGSAKGPPVLGAVSSPSENVWRTANFAEVYLAPEEDDDAFDWYVPYDQIVLLLAPTWGPARPADWRGTYRYCGLGLFVLSAFVGPLSKALSKLRGR
ncbi:hypothetical protein [Xanthobacter sp. VNH20]|uniref:hypothetical protein n=1 Tax=Xanthobacter sp. VNH20 TaxID=3156616 RepID=UPI0032B3AC9E